jgi:hypothetical protein
MRHLEDGCYTLYAAAIVLYTLALAWAVSVMP